MREVLLRLPQRKGVYEEALSEALESEDVFGDGAAALRELLEALRSA